MSFITTGATRIHWNGTDAYWHAGTKTLKYASDTGAWTQVATTTVNESIYNQTCFDHLGGKLYWRAASEDFLRIYTLSTGLVDHLEHGWVIAAGECGHRMASASAR